MFTWLFVVNIVFANEISDHVFGGVPTDRHVNLRQGYVMSYDEDNCIPEWGHICPETELMSGFAQ